MACYELKLSIAWAVFGILTNTGWGYSQPPTPHHDDVQITLLDVPYFVEQGDDAVFRCEYNSTNEMYSIKWYRNYKEFFYYIPSLDPPKRVLPMSGVNVNAEKSDGRLLELRNVSLDTEGRFKCEVSTEWPHYYTADKSQLMKVLVIPDEKPMIYGALEQYRLGDTVSLMCMSAPSKPEAILTWYINGREAPPSMLDPLPSDSEGRLRRSRLSLSFIVTKEDFVRGQLTLQCSSVVASHRVYEKIVFNVPVMNAEERAALSGYSSRTGRVLIT